MVGKNIFANYAFKYFDLGIPVIPLNGKIPIISNWQVWSHREQTEEELEALVEKYPNANIGAVMGLWGSGLDLDTDKPEIIQAMPYSPYRRVGLNGGGIVIMAKSDIENIPQDKYPVEFLNHGRQIVLPPSIHPVTGKPYEWVGDEDFFLNFDPKELLVFDIRQIQILYRLCEKHQILSKRAQRSQGEGVKADLTDTGRNNKLCAMAYAKACDDTPVKEAVEALLDFDKKEHTPAWFSDPTEPHRGRDPRGQAEKMYKRAQAKAKLRGDVRPHVEFEYAPEPIQGAEDVWIPYPKPRGLMGMFVDYCQLTSSGAQDALGLGGAIALMSVLCSNRFRSRFGAHDVWPNTFVINLAYSGFGKETCQRVIDELLADTSLVGSGTYKSGTSIVMNLPEQQERVDLVDECSSLLKAMSSPEDYKSEIVEILSSLYSKSNSRYIGMASRADGARFGACWNPCVNILGSTTPAGFRSSVNRDMAAKGLMPRFLVFYQRHVGTYQNTFDNEITSALFSELKRRVNMILSVEKKLHEKTPEKNLVESEEAQSKRYDPEIIPMSEAALNELLDIQRHYFNEGSKDPEGFDSAFKNRFAQHISKLALLDAISLGLAEITTENINWAQDVVEISWENVKQLYELASAENAVEKNYLIVKNFIKSKGQTTRREISRKLTRLTPKELDSILKSLEDGGVVHIGKSKQEGHGGKPSTVITFTKDLMT